MSGISSWFNPTGSMLICLAIVAFFCFGYFLIQQRLLFQRQYSSVNRLAADDVRSESRLSEMEVHETVDTFMVELGVNATLDPFIATQFHEVISYLSSVGTEDEASMKLVLDDLQSGNTFAAKTFLMELKDRYTDAKYQDSHIQLSKISYYLGCLAYLDDQDEALNFLEEAAELNPANFSSPLMLGRIYREQGHEIQSDNAYQSAYQVAEELNHWVGQANALQGLGSLYLLMDFVDQAKSFLDKALELETKLEREAHLALVYVNLANAYRSQGEFGKARELYQKAMAAYNNMDSQEGVAIQYGNLGIVASMQKDWRLAINYYQTAINIYNELGRSLDASNQYSNLGLVHYQCQQWDKAIMCFNQALDMDWQAERNEKIAEDYINLGVTYRECKDFEKAREFFTKAQHLYEGLSNRKQIDKLQIMIRELVARESV